MRHHVAVFTSFIVLIAFSANAQDAKPWVASKTRTTIIERSSGQRIAVTTSETGIRVVEQGSGRLIWSASRDSHELKIGEYTAGGWDA